MAESSTTHSISESRSSFSRRRGAPSSRMKASTPPIICSICSTSASTAPFSAGGAASSLKRMRASGVRRSWLIAPTIAVRSRM